MKEIIAILSLVCLCSASQIDLSRRIDKFSIELFLQFSSTKANTIISPFSVHDDVIMAGSGAKGKTFTEIRKALNLAGNRDTIAVSYQQLLDPLYDPASVLKVANGVYIQSGLTIKTDYSDLLTTHYHTSVKSLDFKQPQDAAGVINSDVSTATNGLIQDIIDPSTLSASTQIVLVNSIYFKNNWLHPFPAANTQPQTFYAGDPSNSIQIATMEQSNYMMVANLHALDATLISLPYADQCYTFNILLPKTKTGLADLENRLRNRNLGTLSRNAKRTYVNLFMPSFEITTSLSLKEALENLGMKTAFTTNADFSLMTEEQSKLSISSVVHKAYIKVDENGTVAAAATGTEITTTAIEVTPPPVVIKVDHPFLFYISDCNDSVFFLGDFYGV